MHFFLVYLKQHRIGIFVFFLFCTIFAGLFLLYHVPVGAVLYPAILCTVIGTVFLLFDFFRIKRRHERLLEIQKLSGELMTDFPEADSSIDADYYVIIEKLREELNQLEKRWNLRYSDMVNYYTIWAHQIKTPIASMRLNLQNEDSEFSRSIAEDLSRIEQYVEMVLCYLRLNAESTDYIIQEYDLDEIVKPAVKKFAGQFIRKKLRLVYQPLHAKVITDEKWLQFVLEQVISNAIKYTPSGEITIEPEEIRDTRMEKSIYGGKENIGYTLCIRDTGIGIAAEDLPRIFENGYTGYNGRSDKKASGIGLYLCRRICRKLGHNITVNSSPDSGTVVKIQFGKDRLEVE